MCVQQFKKKKKYWDTVEFLMTEEELVHFNDFNMEITHLHKALVTL